MSGPPEWYAASQAAICLGAGWAILAMHRRGIPVRTGEATPVIARDPALGWLGIAVVVWGLVGVVLLLPLDETTALALRSPLSSVNNAALLISASHLDYGLEFLQRARDWAHWRKAALLGSLAVAIATLVGYATVGPSDPLAQLPDFLLSVGTLALYGIGLMRSFVKRGFPMLAMLAVAAVFLTALAQLPEVLGEGSLLVADRRWSLLLVSKTLTLVAFLALAMSWVHEVARRPSTGGARLRFTGEVRLGPQNRRRWIVIAEGGELELRETPHRDLLVLALARLSDADREHGGWMALPDLVGRLDDSRIRRMREDLRPLGLDATIETNFQKCYRLAIAPEHIELDRNALAKEKELGALLERLALPAARRTKSSA
ncbi:MAG TPA: hypothetical protein VG755_09260 [Nannocystaceae bacterium]|nr:hypothetical protein [Nannocystaceae bacterium]